MKALGAVLVVSGWLALVWLLRPRPKRAPSRPPSGTRFGPVSLRDLSDGGPLTVPEALAWRRIVEHARADWRNEAHR